MSGLVQWVLFLLLSAVAVLTAAGMLLTMSMYRAGLALMSSFVALAGLFLLLDADLLAAIQVMMNVGGMLVMVLFMVMLMIDPGGEMMWDMKRKMRLPGPGAFSMSMPSNAPPAAPAPSAATAPTTDWTCPMHPEVSAPGPGDCPICGMALIPRAELQGGDGASAPPRAQTWTCPMHPQVRQPGPGQCPICGMDLVPADAGGDGASPADGHGAHAMPAGADGHGGMAMSGAEGGGHAMPMPRMSAGQHYRMMVDMAMSTAQLPWAIALGVATAVAMIVLVVRTSWPVAPAGPTEDATTAVGELLLGRYMVAFEGAAFLILAGIVGAVIFAKREAAPPPAAPAAAALAGGRVYTCPMHPRVRQEQPGECPICGMDLVPAEETPAPVAAAPATAGRTYTCPMHPRVRQDHPGQCPICGMDLVPAEEEHVMASQPQQPQTYTCPMHPEVRQNGPGRCPKCGMNLVPAQEGAPAGAGGRDHGGHA